MFYIFSSSFALIQIPLVECVGTIHQCTTPPQSQIYIRQQWHYISFRSRNNIEVNACSASQLTWFRKTSVSHDSCRMPCSTNQYQKRDQEHIAPPRLSSTMAVVHIVIFCSACSFSYPVICYIHLVVCSSNSVMNTVHKTYMYKYKKDRRGKKISLVSV